MDFPTLLRKHREKRGLTQQQLASRLGITRSGLGMIEQGERAPSLDSINDFTEALGLEGDEREEFVFLADVSHLPESARARVVGVHLLQQIEHARIDRLHASVTAIHQLCERLQVSFRAMNKRIDRVDAFLQTVLARSQGVHDADDGVKRGRRRG